MTEFIYTLSMSLTLSKSRVSNLFELVGTLQRRKKEGHFLQMVPKRKLVSLKIPIYQKPTPSLDCTLFYRSLGPAGHLTSVCAFFYSMLVPIDFFSNKRYKHGLQRTFQCQEIWLRNIRGLGELQDPKHSTMPFAFQVKSLKIFRNVTCAYLIKCILSLCPEKKLHSF